MLVNFQLSSDSLEVVITLCGLTDKKPITSQLNGPIRTITRVTYHQLVNMIQLTLTLKQAFSQTLKTGCPEGMFSHKIIRDKGMFLIFLPKWASIGQLDTILAKTLLWRWLPHRLLKCQSLSTIVLFRTTFTQKIILNLLMNWLLGSNVSQYVL